ncbi:MAG: excinuclease ABC subunit UvrC [Treponema sp.]|nr:excinuclease ABC subunit UvrC [Treponema sp.]
MEENERPEGEQATSPDDRPQDGHSLSPHEVLEMLHQTALKAPDLSGVYLWKNTGGTVIYVGKAKNLKNRLTSYFNSNKDIKTRMLVSHASSIEYITTNNEYEAFLLENNLIKKYTPRYNINLKDGKSYPVLRVTKEEYPRLFKTRHIVQDGSMYFGPFPDAGALDTFVDTIYEIYPLRHCKTFREKASPCLYYHIGRCLAPCCKDVDESRYGEFISEIISLVEGSSKAGGTERLEAQMKEAAARMDFEKAARIRDGIKALSVLRNQNIVEGFDGDDRDYLASWREGELVSFTVLKIRAGKLLGRDNYRTVSLNEDTELLPEFMGAYYTEKESIPPHIYVMTGDGMEIIRQWISESYGIQADISLVRSGMEGEKLHQAALEMARQNAKEDIIRRMRERGDFPAMEELQKVLSLPTLPVRIEGFDIAHIGGKFPVASLISFYNGNPDKKNYREFRLKTTDGIIDDFASMKEATSRRYTRLVNENKPLPDLILIDGGIGQVNAVDDVISSLGLDIPIAGLAKRDEEIWRPHASKPVCLPKRSDALRLLQRVRDETHRFATSRNQELRTKENVVSPFVKLPNVGKERDKILMKEYGTLSALCAAPEADISRILHVRANQASDILLAAKELLRRQEAQKARAGLSLDLPGTTKEKAARYKINHDLAASALGTDDEPDGTAGADLMVASPTEESGGYLDSEL